MPDTENANADALNDSLEALGHPFRRRILTRLHDRNPRDEAEFSAAELADDADGSHRLELDIHHNHLPRLAEAGFVDWDRDENVVTRGPRFPEIAPLIELMANHPDELPVGWP